jgi:hypothetical protein
MMTPLRPNQALVNRLLITLDPLFFSYSEAEQNTCRQRFDVTRSDQMFSFLYKELFSLTYDPNSEEETLSDSQVRLLNAYTTALLGIGENSFRLCELQGEAFDLTAFASLYEYDVAEYEFQRQAREKASPESGLHKDYRLRLNHDWARFLDSRGDFYYSTLSSLSRYLYDELESVALDMIEMLIPHQWVEGPNHGKDVKGGMEWDMRTDANGLEAELDELHSRARQYLSDVCDELDEEFHVDTGDAVYFLKNRDDPNSPHWDVVVKNASTSKNITFMTFLSDCQKLLQSNEQIEAIKLREVEKLKRFLTQTHRDILDNFDPKVVPLKKRVEIVMSPGALDDLSHLGTDEET